MNRLSRESRFLVLQGIGFELALRLYAVHLADARLCRVSLRAGPLRLAIPHYTGAVPFKLLMLTVSIMGLGSAGEVASADPQTKRFWFLFQDACMGVEVIFPLFFALEYAGLGKWVTHRNAAVLFVPGVINIALSFTNEFHHLKWSRIWFEGGVRSEAGPAAVAMTIYGMALLLLTSGIFIVLFVRSPLHRWPVGLILLGQLAPRIALPLWATNLATAAPFHLMVLSFDFTAPMYALALFRFHFFNVVPVGRDTAMERMTDGVLILDAKNRMVDLNHAAEKVLTLVRKATIGRPAGQALAAYPDLSRLLEQETDFMSGRPWRPPSR